MELYQLGLKTWNPNHSIYINFPNDYFSTANFEDKFFWLELEYSPIKECVLFYAQYLTYYSESYEISVPVTCYKYMYFIHLYKYIKTIQRDEFLIPKSLFEIEYK